MKKSIIIISTLLSISNMQAEYLYTHGINVNISGAAENSGINTSTITCTQNHCAGLKDGEVWTIGSNTQGQLGLGNHDDHNTWQNTGVTATAVKAIGTYNTAIIKDGTLWIAGYNYYGQMGIGTNNTFENNFINTNEVINSLDDIAAGTTHIGIIKNGTLYTAGFNHMGQLGLGHTTPVYNFTSTTKSVDSIYFGEHNSYYLKNGEAFGAGDNYYGQLAKGTSGNGTQELNFISLGITDISKFSAGGQYIMVLKNDKSLWSVGSNWAGQLATGNNTNRSSWVNVNTNVDDVKAGLLQSYIKKNGTIWGAGYNSHGQLGINSTTDQTSFVDTGETGEFMKTSYAAYALHFIKDGKRYMAGYNVKGIFGDGSNTHRLVAEEAVLP